MDSDVDLQEVHLKKMASKCFYLIIISAFFVSSYCIAELVSEFDNYHYTYQIDRNENIDYKSLVRNKRQISKTDSIAEKPEVPPEDKTKITKKPISVPKIGTSSAELTKSKAGIKSKENTKAASTSTPPPFDSHETIHEHDHVDNPNHDHSQEHVHSGEVHIPVSSSEASPSSSETPTNKTWIKASGPPLTNITVPDTEIQFNKFFNVDINETLKEHNITSQQEDHHLYYNSSFLVDSDIGKQYWVNIDNHPNTKVSDILSKSHRRAVTVKLSFDFPFYGHLIRNITIATGGFLYTGEYVHSWLAATQYIAPLMANFDTSLSNSSFVKYLDNGTAFTVQWENVVLQEKPNDGFFTFQCTLFQNGNIVFVYQHVALIIESIEDSQHPVKVGLSDAYIIDRTIFFVRRKTIYEYHRVQFNREDIKNWTVILLNALDTCLDMKDCHSCLTQVPKFQCNWCADRCSNGMDRYRQDWLTRGCEKAKLKSLDECPLEEEHSMAGTQSSLAQPVDGGQNNSNIGIAGIMGILFTICFLIGLSVCLLYAYRNPHSPTGQFLIRYRPSQWSWRRGEARYTAATIHM